MSEWNMSNFYKYVRIQGKEQQPVICWFKTENSEEMQQSWSPK